MATTDAEALLTPEAVRLRARMLLALARRNELEHFIFDETRLHATADYVAEIIRARYRELKVPFHARWRHFVIDGEDRYAPVTEALRNDRRERLRAAFDVAITSVLLDAGAGPAWRYRDKKTRQDLARSEGLALASLDAIAAGLFADDGKSLRADADALANLEVDRLADAFQVRADNPLDGIDGRAALLRALGFAAQTRDEFVGDSGRRVGHLADYIIAQCPDGRIPARTILVAVLRALGRIWPSRLALDGVPLGDTWKHPAIATNDATAGFIPFHKLSQWLSYSLIEPLEAAGLRVTGVDALTGLAEYRNGGLFVDFDVLAPRNPAMLELAHLPASEFIVEWRGLTVALLDEIAPLVRARLKVSEKAMPLASILEGGTWAAGRKIAAEKREGGTPPIHIAADGTVF